MDIQVIDLKNIRSLTDFKRHTAELIEQLKDSGLPLVLTVNGKAEVVVLSAESFQRLTTVTDRQEVTV